MPAIVIWPNGHDHLSWQIPKWPMGGLSSRHARSGRTAVTCERDPSDIVHVLGVVA